MSKNHRHFNHKSTLLFTKIYMKQNFPSMYLIKCDYIKIVGKIITFSIAGFIFYMNSI